MLYQVPYSILMDKAKEIAPKGQRPRRGRPPKHGATMMAHFTIRMPPVMMAAIERIVADRKDGADTAQVIRELLAKALEADGQL